MPISASRSSGQKSQPPDQRPGLTGPLAAAALVSGAASATELPTLIRDGVWLPLFHTALAHPAVLVLPVGCSLAVAAARMDAVGRFRNARLRSRHGHLGQPKACRRYSRYTELIRDHTRLLQVSPEELSLSAGLPLRVVRYFYNNPTFIPRPEHLECICRTLLVPLGWIRGEGDYGDYYVERRVLRLHDRNHALGVTLADFFTETDPAARRAMLQAMETQLREDFDLPPSPEEV